jgi:D-methionine transport system substrate-binding protein
MESASSPYVNALVSREDNKDSDKIQKLKAALQSPEVAAKAEEVYKGDAIKGW